MSSAFWSDLARLRIKTSAVNRKILAWSPSISDDTRIRGIFAIHSNQTEVHIDPQWINISKLASHCNRTDFCAKSPQVSSKDSDWATWSISLKTVILFSSFLLHCLYCKRKPRCKDKRGVFKILDKELGLGESSWWWMEWTLALHCLRNKTCDGVCLHGGEP